MNLAMSRDRTEFGPAWFRDPPVGLARARGRSAARAGRRRLARGDPCRTRRGLSLDRHSPQSCDVICAGMYRACSTWQYEVVGHLIERHLRGERLGYLTGEAYASAVTPLSGREADADGGRRSWRVLKSHEGHRSFARALNTGQALAVYAFRELRDVIFSLMYKRDTTFPQLLRQGMIHQILVNDRFWRAQPRVLVQRYEELIADPVTAVVQLARHLGLGVTRREATEIADDYSLESNQTRIEALRRRLEQAGIDLEHAGNLQVCDPVTLLHWNHLRPGGAVSWRTDATPRERALLDRICGSWLRANGYASEPEDYALAEGAGYDCTLGLREDLALAIGRLASFLRTAALHCPRTARWVKQLLGMPDSAPETVVSWADAQRPAVDSNQDPTRVLEGDGPEILSACPVG